MMRELIIIGAFFILKASGQCTFPSPWASSTWLDSTRGTITFGTTTLSGWSTTVFNQQINSWQCVDNSSSTTLVMRSTSPITYSSSAFYGFLCMQLTQISTNSYTYVLQQIQQQNAGNERLWFSDDGTLSDVSTICNSSASIPTLEFHVLVKQGMADSAAITFPNSLLFSADYQYMASDGTVACNSSDTMDMCTDQTALSFNNYTNCNQEIAYSAGGELWCVATASLSTYDCAVVFNRDATISGTASQFACLCSDGSSVSVVSGNCTADQTPTSYPTAADGTTVIGYLLNIQSVYVNCAPTTTSSAASNAGLIAGIVIVVLIIIAIIIVSIYLYKRGHCEKICDRLDGCLEKTPCWKVCRSKVCVCCKNKVDGVEAEKPMLSNGAVSHSETVNETSSKRPKLQKDKTSMSAITRSSTMGVTRQKSDLEKSLQRQTTATSIGIDLKSEKSSVHQIKVKSQDEDDDKKEPRLKILGLDLSVLVCCPEKKETVKEVTVVEPSEKPLSPKKNVTAKGGGKKAAGVKGKGKGGKGKGKGGKGKEETKEETNEGKELKQEGEKAKQKGKKKDTKSQDQLVDTARSVDVTLTDVEGKMVDEVESDINPKGKKKDSKFKDKQKDTARSDDVTKSEANNNALMRAPTKMKSDLHLTSTPIPGGEKGQKGVVSVPTGLLKPQDKTTEWTFLACCFGNRSPPTPEEKVEDAPVPVTQAKKKPGAKPGAKGKGAAGKKEKGGGGAAKKAVKKGGGDKGGGKKKDVNENDMVAEDLEDELPGLDRAKTMPEREKTTLSLQDAEKVKVAVYIPTDKTNLQLKDTVINGKPKLEKSKTDAGLVRPPSSRPVSSVKQNGKSGKKGNKKTDKGKDGGKKDKKGAKKKKK